jgi:hypothetical protein
MPDEFLTTIPGTQMSWEIEQRRPCWRCRWHLRWPPWRKHWGCVMGPVLRGPWT